MLLYGKNYFRTSRLLLILVLLFIFSSPQLSYAQTPASDNSFYVAFNYPGLGLGWSGRNHSIEFKGYFDGTNWGMGPRFNYHWGHFDRGSVYLGFEYLSVNFEGEISEGDGIMVGVAQGIELFFEEHTSLKLDVGPYQTDLEDNDSSVTEDGWDVVMNIGLNIYF
jgi:hypothetical protein